MSLTLLALVATARLDADHRAAEIAALDARFDGIVRRVMSRAPPPPADTSPRRADLLHCLDRHLLQSTRALRVTPTPFLSNLRADYPVEVTAFIAHAAGRLLLKIRRAAAAVTRRFSPCLSPACACPLCTQLLARIAQKMLATFSSHRETARRALHTDFH